MLMETSELTGAALDAAVAQYEGVIVEYIDDGITRCLLLPTGGRFSPSTDWAQGGPILERERIELQWIPSQGSANQYGARKPSLGGLNRTFCADGPTPLIAAMRCYVASKLGDTVDVKL
jgi:hypothetical protein